MEIKINTQWLMHNIKLNTTLEWFLGYTYLMNDNQAEEFDVKRSFKYMFDEYDICISQDFIDGMDHALFIRSTLQ